MSVPVGSAIVLVVSAKIAHASRADSKLVRRFLARLVEEPDHRGLALCAAEAVVHHRMKPCAERSGLERVGEPVGQIAERRAKILQCRSTVRFVAATGVGAADPRDVVRSQTRDLA